MKQDIGSINSSENLLNSAFFKTLNVTGFHLTLHLIYNSYNILFHKTFAPYFPQSLIALFKSFS
jgi:hypothetical protein